MLREFTYTSTKETKERKILVFKENDSYIEGLDITVLEPETQVHLLSTYKDYQPTCESVKIDGWNPEWNRAWRRFCKSNIC